MPPDYFEFLELPRNLAIDLKDLEKRFHTLSRKWHPDMFARKSAAEREAALDASALLNDAYRTLRDPLARATYLLKLEGFDIGEQTTKDVPPELLEEVFDLNMALEEVRMGDTDALPQLAAAKQRFEGMREEIDTQVRGRFAEWDASRNRDTLAEIRGLLNRRKYITNLIKQANVSDRV